MTFSLKDVANGQLCGTDDSLQVKAVRFYRAQNMVQVELVSAHVLPVEDYLHIENGISELCGSAAELIIDCEDQVVEPSLLRGYLLLLKDTEFDLFARNVFTFHPENKQMVFILQNDRDLGMADQQKDKLTEKLVSFGFPVLNVDCRPVIVQQAEIEEVPVSVVQSDPKPAVEKFRKRSSARSKDYDAITLKDADTQRNVTFTGDIFNIEEKEIRKKESIIQFISVFDGTGAIKIKRFFKKEEYTGDVKNEFAIGDRIAFYGSLEFDTFEKALIAYPRKLEKQDKPVITDDAPVKRVEFHMHSNMSEMDGVCEPKEIVTYAYQLGHPGVVITDHSDVQSLVKAFNTGAGLKKANPDRPFKVGLGSELNMVNDELLIVRHPTDQKLDSMEYVSYDLETTGLSCYYDSIIEFGAVKIRNSQEIDRLQMFIKPPVPIPAYITKKTNISNAMVENALPFAKAYKKIVDWLGDDVLVAHNASFDFNFMNEELRRIGQPPLQNTVIDTLDMARAVLRDRKAYRLGNISRYYHVTYDEDDAHRADYDAEALAGVFACLLNDARRKYGAETIRDLQNKIQDSSCYNKIRPSHVCAVVKNQDGVRDLYKLITESNTVTLAENTPVIRRSSLQKMRQNLLLGSACLNGDVWEMACNGDDARLERTMAFYDYIELQPLGNYSIDLEPIGGIPNVERLKQIQKRIIAMAKKLNKPVIADSDAHYCKKEEKIFRDVYVCASGVGGTIHPLYIRDEALRHRFQTPDQHLRTTAEMNNEFSWLEDDDLVDELVVRNPNALLDQIEEARPVPAGTFPPTIEGSDEKLRKICHDTCARLYSFEGKIPDIVENRLDEELDNIIRNGYGVHYYIAHLLVKKSNEDGYLVGSRGSVGSSFTATMAGITEVNALPPHYLCPKCHYSEWITDPSVKSGFDLPDKVCPHCGAIMKGNGHNIPFQTFLGFNADKVPDIDLNFSDQYQSHAHAFIREIFGADHAFRAGTIGTVAEKTAYGYVSGYCEKMGIENMSPAMRDYLAKGCQNVKRTTGQHPGGIIIIPSDHVAEDFTPIQYPANDPTADWKTTHYDFHDIHDNVLKFDILGHVDPTAMRMLQTIGTMKPLDIPMNDPETLSLFYSDEALKADPRIYKKPNGALGLPEFGTKTTRNVLIETKPKKFSELVMISGLTHGTDVWAGNAQKLVEEGHPLEETIACRDDIMTYLLGKDLKPIDAFKTMEDVRKGRGLRPDQEKNLRDHNVPEWYIDSCKKIKYMFPKAHAVAYVMMAVRIAWYKVHEPHNFYIQFFTHRCDAYEIETMASDIDTVRARMAEISEKMQSRDPAHAASNKEKSLYDVLEVCEEMYARGYRMSNVDLYHSQATDFCILPGDTHTIIPPFTVIDGLGANVARSVVAARDEAPFLSKEDIMKRTQLSQTLLKKLDDMGVLPDLEETNQMSLF